jgi:hypothetical protein
VLVLTSLTVDEANPEQFAAHVRGHWGIENRLHWVRDVTYGEDHSQIRTERTAHVMATLRNLAISLHRLNGAINTAQALALPCSTQRLLTHSQHGFEKTPEG